MRIAEPRQYHGPFQITLLIPLLGKSLLGIAQIHDPVIFHAHGLIAGHGPIHGDNPAIIPKPFHHTQSFPPHGQVLFIFLSKPRAKFVQNRQTGRRNPLPRKGF